MYGNTTTTMITSKTCGDNTRLNALGGRVNVGAFVSMCVLGGGMKSERGRLGEAEGREGFECTW